MSLMQTTKIMKWELLALSDICPGNYCKLCIGYAYMGLPEHNLKSQEMLRRETAVLRVDLDPEFVSRYGFRPVFVSF